MQQSPRITFSATLERKDPRLPVYVVVPYAVIEPWLLQGTTVVEGEMNGLSVGRRTIKRWDSSDEANWFVELTAPFCKAAGIKVGDQLTVSLVIAAASTPRELEVLLQQDPQCRVAWGKLSEAARRTIMEHIRAGKSETIRVRRAESAVQDLGQLTYVRRPAKK